MPHSLICDLQYYSLCCKHTSAIVTGPRTETHGDDFKCPGIQQNLLVVFYCEEDTAPN